MSQVAVVFWSGTGNTESMANYVEEGAQQAGAVVTKMTAADFKPEMVSRYNAIAFGCPSMGEEVLEESEFQPMFDSVKASLSAKKIALFGSYGWGDGQWMRDWEEECKSLGAVMACDALIVNDAPDDDGVESCKTLGAALASE